MSRLIASELALRALLALSQRPDGMRPAEMARILGLRFSSVERALAILADDGLIEDRGVRKVLAATPQADEAVRFAAASLSANAALAALVRASEVVEFCGLDDLGATVVIRRFSEPADEARLRRTIATLSLFHPTLKLGFVAKEELRERLLDDIAPRRRAQAMRLVKGSIDRSFPDRTRHGDPSAQALGRLNDQVTPPSRRRLRDLARRHRLRRIVAFGSATRSDFRPDSDLDLLVEPVADRPLGLRERVEIMAEVESLFERDVDLVAAGEARPSLAARIEREGVVLHGPAA